MGRCLRTFGLAGVVDFVVDSGLWSLGPTNVHFEFGSLAVGRVRALAANKVKVSVSFRGYDVNFFALDKPLIYSAIDPYLTAVHVLGEDIRKRALARGCGKAQKAVAIPPAIDVGFFSPMEPPRAVRDGDAAVINVLSVGRLEWKKGYEYALEAIRMVLDRGFPVQYRIVGVGPHEAALRVAVRQLRLEGVVCFVGKVDRYGVREELGKADMFLQASVSEGFCNAVVEAQAMEVPIIATDADGLAENVEHGATGYVVSRYSSVALAQALQALAADPEARVAFGKAGRERVLRMFRLEQQEERWRSFFLKTTTDCASTSGSDATADNL